MKKFLHYFAIFLLPLGFIWVVIKYIFDQKSSGSGIEQTQTKDDELQNQQNQAQNNANTSVNVANEIQVEIEKPNTNVDWHKK